MSQTCKLTLEVLHLRGMRPLFLIAVILLPVIFFNIFAGELKDRFAFWPKMNPCFYACKFK